MQNNLEKIKSEVVNCTKCSLHKQRTNAVAGEGSSKADIMFIGEAPGYNEDQTGRPFCGKAGKILDELLDSIGIKRENIFITNIVKCRPPGNRNPTSEEINTCTPYLDRQIELIKPKIIGCLGNFATAYIMKRFGLKDKIQGVSKIHSKVFTLSTLLGPIKIIPLYHPAVATYNPNMKDVLLKDFKKLVQS